MHSHIRLIAGSLSLIALAACSPATDGTGNSDSSTSSSVAVEQTGDAYITSLQANDTVTSPLTLEGKALGTWYFEASFPIKLVDQNQQLIAQGVAQAQGDWMTTDLVPFTSTLTFTTNATSGFLILQKDNPSGMPENDQSISIPVNF